MRIAPLALSLIALSSATGVASAQATFEFIGQGIGITDLSQDGTVAVGNTISDGVYETFRWVEGDPNGWTRLGQATVPVLGTGAGSPDVSYDGTRVSATILGPQLPSRENPYATQGIWSAQSGAWTELIPALPPSCVLLDNSYSSAWGLSGDGTTLSGFYWNNSPFHGSAWPCVSTIAGGAVGLAAPLGKSGRINAVSYDGAIGVGWTEDQGGAWMATVWRDGTYTWINPDLGYLNNVSATAESINADGSIIVGQTYNVNAARRDPARWTWNGTSYDLTNLGVLPGTPQTSIANVWAESVSDDGSIIVGMNQFRAQGPFSLQTGFVWTPEDGMRSIEEVLADYGFALPQDYIVQGLVVSPDGSTIGGTALDPNTTGFFDYWAFIFRYPPPPCPGDLDGNGTTDVLDFAIFGANFGATGLIPNTGGDFDGDGDVDIFDFAIFTSDFGCGTGVN